MAGFPRRRRGPQGPNKNEQKVQQREAAERRVRSAGSLADRFPSVERLSISLEFRGPQDSVLGSENRVFRGADIVELAAPCPGLCGVGNFDLAAKIEQVVIAREPASQASGVCQERLYAGSPDVCGCRLACRIEISYKPEPKPEPKPADAPLPAGA